MKSYFTKIGILFLVALTSCNANTKKQTLPLLAINQQTPIIKKDNTIQVALLLDTSNSMDGLIDQAKAQLWDIVNELSYAKCEHENPNLEIAIYQYGNDNLEASDGYIEQVIGFSSDLDEISEKLFSLSTNGGSEYCGQVVQTSLKNLRWKKGKNDLKLIFIAGNEAFTQGKINYKDAVTDALEKDVTINTIFCGNYTTGISGKWKAPAVLTNGDYMAIDHNHKEIHISTPYDTLIINLNSKLNGTYVSYGSKGASKIRLQAKQDVNALEVSEEIVVKRAVSKSSRIYNNASWDLVDAAKKKDFDYTKIDKNQLPKELKSKSTKEIKAYVALKKAERIKIQEEIKQLNKKRRDYIATKNKNATKNENLESALIHAIKKQAIKKNYKW